MYLRGRDGQYNAEAVYEDGIVTVKKGSLIRASFADHVRGGRVAKRYRDDPEVLGKNGRLCVYQPFDSGSICYGEQC